MAKADTGSSFDGSVQFNYTFGGLVSQMEM